jgi:hypothetical protein
MLTTNPHRPLRSSQSTAGRTRREGLPRARERPRAPSGDPATGSQARTRHPHAPCGRTPARAREAATRAAAPQAGRTPRRKVRHRTGPERPTDNDHPGPQPAGRGSARRASGPLCVPLLQKATPYGRSFVPCRRFGRATPYGRSFVPHDRPRSSPRLTPGLRPGRSPSVVAFPPRAGLRPAPYAGPGAQGRAHPGPDTS